MSAVCSYACKSMPPNASHISYLMIDDALDAQFAPTSARIRRTSSAVTSFLAILLGMSDQPGVDGFTPLTISANRAK